MHHSSTYIKIMTLAAAAWLTGCRKETEYAPSPYKEIESFSVATSANTMMLGAVDGDSILIYWPSYISQPATVMPEIKVSGKATITPASGTAIALATGTKYTVTAADGSKKAYFLKLIINQPGIQVNENASYAAVKGGVISINTNKDVKYLVEDATVTKAALVGSDGKETLLSVAFATRNNVPYIDLTIPDNEAVKPGAYKLKFTSGAVTFTTAAAVAGVLYPATMKPQATTLNEAVSIKRGAEITFKGTGFTDMQDARVWAYSATWAVVELGTLKMVSFTATTATYQVPANFPTGTYQLGAYTDKGMFIQLRTSDYFPGWNWMNVKKVYADVPGSATITITD
ncbi:hypothetical protein [Chitinophaga sp. Cy-1792]|uniref:hypothetical protein n=1 Tax=Chitinophaga sp. Cy-1792 TaxID=2608339 RepID=UPI00141FA1ED|nr:hypothetical protein [Chitinophaga sp. Cy-1792]NIG56391.1 hypothetical protein [Chitinophaga sp. Cy-1792]